MTEEPQSVRARLVDGSRASQGGAWWRVQLSPEIFLRLSGAAESGGRPWPCGSVVLMEIECSQSVNSEERVARSDNVDARHTRLSGGVC